MFLRSILIENMGYNTVGCGARGKALVTHTDVRAAVDCLPQFADNCEEVFICHEKGWWFGVHNNT